MLQTSQDRRRVNAGFLFVLPALILFLTFIFYPLISNIYMSLFKIKFSFSGLSWQYVQWDNYLRLLQDPTFGDGVIHSLIWALWAIVIDIPIALLLALLLSTKMKGWRFFRTAWFLPLLLSYVFTALIWSWIYNLDWGIINSILRTIGLGVLVQDWIGSSNTALVAVMLVQTWHTVGYNLVLILAGIFGIPEEIFDLMKLEGLNWFQKIYYVIIPMIRRILVVTLQLAVIGKLRLFELVFVMTQGGPFGSTETVVTYIIKRAYFWSGQAQFGYSAAMSVIWAIAIIGITLFINKALQTKEALEY